MGKLYNRAKMTVSGTPGTGTITLGTAVSGFQSFAQAGTANSDVVSYVIEDGGNYEYGQGTYSTTGPTLARTTINGSYNGTTYGTSAISVSSTATVMISPLASDLPVIASGKSLTVSNILTLAGTDSTTMTFPSASDTVVGAAATQTLTNKWIQPRILASTANSATPTLNTDNYDMMVITGQTLAITSFTTNLTGTPVNGQKLWIAITGTGAIAITWGAKFAASGTVALPTTTVSSTRLDVGFIWNVTASAWMCVAVA